MSFVVDIVNMVFITFFLGKFSDKIPKWKLLAAVLILGVYSFGIWDYITLMDGNLGTLLILLVLFSQGKVWERILLYAEIQVILLTIDSMIVDVLYEVRKHMGWRITLEQCVQWSEYSRGIVVCIVLLCLWGKREDIRRIVNQVTLPQAVYFIASFSTFLFCLGMSQIYLLGYSAEKLMPLFSGAIVLFGATQIILCFMIFHMQYAHKKIKGLLEMNEAAMKMQKHYYEEMDEKNIKIRKFRHDFREHIYALDDMLRQKEYETMENYMRELVDIKDEITYIQTGNLIVNAVVNRANEWAMEQSIIFRQAGMFPKRIEKISDTDLCTLLSNALRNAIEAAGQVEDMDNRWVELSMGKEKDILYFVVKNAANSVNIKEGKLLTSKEETSEHGIGMENMKEVVERGGGTMKWVFEERVFTLKIIFFLGK